MLKGLKPVFWWLPFGRVPGIGPVDLERLIEGGRSPQILDVRTGAEWRRSHVVGSVNVPIQSLKRRLASLQLDPDRPVVAICLSAHRSIGAVRLLRARGFEKAVQLDGGMLAWWREGMTEASADRR